MKGKNMKYLILTILLMTSAMAQDIWKYTGPSDTRTGYDEREKTLTIGAVTDTNFTSWYFGPGVRNTYFNGLLGLKCRLDSVGAGAADTVWFFLIHDLDGDLVTNPDTLTWMNAADSTETANRLILPAVDTKVWVWKNNPVGDYLGSFPSDRFKLYMEVKGTGALRVKNSWYAY